MQSLIFYSLMAASAVGWFAFAFFILWYWQRERMERTRIRQTKADIADIMMLFQTMRDVVSQQKQLASDFNAELERKVGGVKQILQAAIDKNERLYERTRDLERELHDTRSELESMQRQLSFMPPPPAQAAPAKAAPSRPKVIPRAAAAEPEPEPLQVLPSSDEPPFMALPGESAAAPEPEVEEDTAAAAAAPDSSAGPSLWEQVDMAALADHSLLGADVEDEDDEETPGPTDGEAAREAFRALLDLSSRTTPEESPGKPTASKMNAALQQRVAQYAEAGMSVNDISRELGIGKGEVRLMLSLAKPGSS